MTNDRPYRKAMNHEEAIAEIERCAGTQFDPNLVPLFKQIVAAESDKLKEVRHVIQI
jgi:HD-GYP domain-containing protein (c-di-GMP phosphodiesterase class II)